MYDPRIESARVALVIAALLARAGVLTLIAAIAFGAALCTVGPVVRSTAQAFGATPTAVSETAAKLKPTTMPPSRTPTPTAAGNSSSSWPASTSIKITNTSDNFVTLYTVSSSSLETTYGRLPARYHWEIPCAVGDRWRVRGARGQLLRDFTATSSQYATTIYPLR